MSQIFDVVHSEITLQKQVHRIIAPIVCKDFVFESYFRV